MTAPTSTPRRRQNWTRSALIGGLAVLAAGTGIWYTSCRDKTEPAATPASTIATKNYVFKGGDRAWNVIDSLFNLGSNRAIAESTNSLGRHNAEKYGRKPYLRDNRAIVDGAVVPRADGIIFDVIRPGDTLTYRSDTAAVRRNAPPAVTSYETVSVTPARGMTPWKWAQQKLGTRDVKTITGYLAEVTRLNPSLQTLDVGLTENGAFTGGEDGLFDNWQAGRTYTIRVPKTYTAPAAETQAPRTQTQPQVQTPRSQAQGAQTQTNHRNGFDLFAIPSYLAGQKSQTQPQAQSQAQPQTRSYAQPRNGPHSESYIQNRVQDRESVHRPGHASAASDTYMSAYGKNHADVMSSYNTLVSQGKSVEDAFRTALGIDTARWSSALGLRV